MIPAYSEYGGYPNPGSDEWRTIDEWLDAVAALGLEWTAEHGSMPIAIVEGDICSPLGAPVFGMTPVFETAAREIALNMNPCDCWRIRHALAGHPGHCPKLRKKAYDALGISPPEIPAGKDALSFFMGFVDDYELHARYELRRALMAGPKTSPQTTEGG